MNAMDYLKSKLSLIDEIIPPGSKIAYIDYPLHLNVGDILILKGTESFFRSRNYNVIDRVSNFGGDLFLKQRPLYDKDTIIALHGGGNFGDLYPAHQRLREEIVLKYPDNKIVLLPQTAHFSTESELLKSSGIFKEHNDLHMLARDTKTLEVFKEHFSENSFLCPDMAHFLWGEFPKKGQSGSINNVLWFMRNDKENYSVPVEFENDITNPVDWSDICTDRDRNVEAMCYKCERVNARLGRKLIPVDTLWYKYTDKLVARIIDYFMKYDKVYTSRMHGHILSCLLDQKVTLFDNSYGKNSSYYDCWTHAVSGCELVS